MKRKSKLINEALRYMPEDTNLGEASNSVSDVAFSWEIINSNDMDAVEITIYKYRDDMYDGEPHAEREIDDYGMDYLENTGHIMQYERDLKDFAKKFKYAKNTPAVIYFYNRANKSIVDQIVRRTEPYFKDVSVGDAWA